MKSTIFALLSASALAQNDPCKTAHTDQASCDADQKTGGGCTWCKCGALPSSCWTLANSKKLPPGVYQCDSADAAADQRTTLEHDQGLATSKSLDWRKQGPSSPSHPVSLLIHLKHTKDQVEELEKHFWSVSDPDHEDYGKHLTKDQVTNIVAHPEAKIREIIQWLSTGSATNVNVGAHRDSIKFTMKVKDVERMFGTTMHTFEHRHRHTVVLQRATSHYSVPDTLSTSIELVSGLLQLPDFERLGANKADDNDKDQKKSGATKIDASWPTDCQGCNGKTTPGVLGARYSFPAPTASDPPSTLAVAEFQGQVWDQSDLNDFSKKCGLNFNVTVNHENGTVAPGNACKIPILGTEFCGEALLDIEYAKGIGGPACSFTDVYAGSYNLLDWSTTVENINDENLISVHSVSYGNDESQQTSAAFMETCNMAFMKIGVRGVSILFAAGDQGVCGRSGCGSDGKRFHPDFPASSPYITSVGGTDFVTRSTIGDEKAWESGGGGFSDTFSIPSYQADAVSQYKANVNAKLPPSSMWNNTGRGYPDVSALGGSVNPYCVAAGSGFTGVYGTSASTPVTAAVFARLNGMRLKSGGKLLGFLNPWIYKNAAAFNDVKEGRNDANTKNGFTAVAGWDAATGVGTPNFALMVKAL